MNIQFNKTTDLNAMLTIALEPNDYSAVVDKNIKDQAKKMQVPGFRKGMVPAGHVKKMYGTSILVDTINNLLSDSINNYLQEQKIEILGQPLIVQDTINKNEWEFDKTFNFEYELGLTPEFEVPFSAKDTYTRYKIVADEATVDKRIKSLQKAYGAYTNPETAEDGDMLYVDFKQLNAEGQTYEGGIEVGAWITWEEIQDADLKAKLIGTAKQTEFVINPQTLLQVPAKIAKAFKVSEAIAIDLKSDFKMLIVNIAHVTDSEINQDLYDKVYGAGVVTTEAEMRKRVKEEYEGLLQDTANQKLQADVYNSGLEKIKIGLPDEFLKRWLKTVNEKPLSDEEIAAEYEAFANNLRWTLIENRILEANELKVDYHELMDLTKAKLQAQYTMYGMSMPENELENAAAKFLNDRTNVNKIFDEAKAKKVFDFLTTSLLTVNEKEIPYDEFLKLHEN